MGLQMTNCEVFVERISCNGHSLMSRRSVIEVFFLPITASITDLMAHPLLG